uniref:Uncharacterized protein n=1 Tax=Arundo donax TaxID=35708 RepID=A0A0A8ZE44_ARUDO
MAYISVKAGCVLSPIKNSWRTPSMSRTLDPGLLSMPMASISFLAFLASSHLLILA